MAWARLVNSHLKQKEFVNLDHATRIWKDRDNICIRFVDGSVATYLETSLDHVAKMHDQSWSMVELLAGKDHDPLARK